MTKLTAYDLATVLGAVKNAFGCARDVTLGTLGGIWLGKRALPGVPVFKGLTGFNGGILAFTASPDCQPDPALR